MATFEPENWQLFLRKMISHNLGLFELAGGEGNREQRLDKLKSWNSAQSGLNSMLKLGSNMKQVEQHGRGKMMFEDEMRALNEYTTSGDVVDEFESYFSSLVGEVDRNNQKYASAMQHLEQLLDLERDTETIKRKASESISVDTIFSASPTNLMDELKTLQEKKKKMMEELSIVYGEKLNSVEPISEEELLPFLAALLNLSTS